MNDPLIVGWAHTKFGKAQAPDTLALMAEVALELVEADRRRAEDRLAQLARIAEASA